METLELREAKAAQQVSGRAGPGTQMSQLPVHCPFHYLALLAFSVTSYIVHEESNAEGEAGLGFF